MSGELEAAAANVLSGLAASRGISIDGPASVALAEKWIAQGVDLLSDHAKAHAAAVGDEAASKITTLEEAEQSAKAR